MLTIPARTHEKGGVEGEVGRFRRRHLVPVPAFASLADLNAFMATADDRDDARRITGRIETVGAAAARELPGLRVLPSDAFDPGESLSCRVERESAGLRAPGVLLGPGPVRRTATAGPPRRPDQAT